MDGWPSHPSARRQRRCLGDRSGSRRRQDRVTTDPGGEFDPAWSSDGKYLAFNSSRSGFYSLYRRRSDGSGSDELVAEAGTGGMMAPNWSPNGKFIIFNYRQDLWMQSLEGDKNRRSPYQHRSTRQPRLLARRSLDRLRFRPHGPPGNLRPALPIERARAEDLAQRRAVSTLAE